MKEGLKREGDFMDNFIERRSASQIFLPKSLHQFGFSTLISSILERIFYIYFTF
jgi:hypothetical protein